MSAWFRKLGFTAVKWMVFFIFRFLHCTYRYRYVHLDYRINAMASHRSRSFLLALWHEHLFASIGAHSFQKISPIISQSSDGDLVTSVVTKMGMAPVRGSSSRGGKQASLELEKMVEEGRSGAITVDGPRGPRRKSKLGIFAIAQSTQALIVPSTALADRYWELSSWDRFKIPKPFARVYIIYGQPIIIPQEIELDRSRLRLLSEELELSLNNLDEEAVSLMSSADEHDQFHYGHVRRTISELHSGTR